MAHKESSRIITSWYILSQAFFHEIMLECQHLYKVTILFFKTIHICTINLSGSMSVIFPSHFVNTMNSQIKDNYLFSPRLQLSLIVLTPHLIPWPSLNDLNECFAHKVSMNYSDRTESKMKFTSLQYTDYHWILRARCETLDCIR